MDDRGPHRDISVANRRAESGWLLLIIAGCVVLRVLGIDWGLPPPLPSVVASGFRCSYALDEDDALTGAARTQLGPSFDPGIYHWGTLHLQLLLAALDTSDKLGLFEHTWRAAYYNMLPGEFERVYRIGRLVTVVIAAAGLLPLFLLGRDLGYRQAGLYAAAIVAVSPAHILNSAQVRVDATMVALVTLVAWLAIRAMQQPLSQTFWLFVGVSAGLAVSAKYSSAIVVVTIIVAALCFVRLSWRPVLLSFGGIVIGFLAGEPGIITHRSEVLHQVIGIVDGVRNVRPEFAIPPLELIARHLIDLTRFSVGLPAALLAFWGGYVLLQRKRAADYLVLLSTAAAIVCLLPQRWVLLRYHLVLVPFVALAAGVGLNTLQRNWRMLILPAALAFPLFGALAEIKFMRDPHPANRVLTFILQTVPPREPVARLQVELPPLNPADYPMGPNPLLDDLTGNPPRWVLITDLPDMDYPAQTVALLRARYRQLAAFQSHRLFPWATLGEQGAPHDWKYTHPRMVLYRLDR